MAAGDRKGHSAGSIVAAGCIVAALAMAWPSPGWSEMGRRSNLCGPWNNDCGSGGGNQDGGNRIYRDNDPAPPANPNYQAARQAFRDGASAYEAGDYAGAEAAFRRVLALEPDNGPAWDNLGRAIQSLKQGYRVSEAVSAYDEAARRGVAGAAERAQVLRSWQADSQRAQAEDTRRAAEEQARRAAEAERSRAAAEQARRDTEQRQIAQTEMPGILKGLLDGFNRETGAQPPSGGLMLDPPKIASLPNAWPPPAGPPPAVNDGAAKIEGTTIDPGDLRQPQKGVKFNEPPPPTRLRDLPGAAKPVNAPPPPKPDPAHLGARAANLVLDAIQDSGHDLDKAARLLSAKIIEAPGDQDVRNATSYVFGMLIGVDRTGEPRRAGAPRLPPNIAAPGLLEGLSPPATPADQRNRARWEGERNRLYLEAMTRNGKDIPATLADLEARARAEPDNSALQSALKVVQGIAVYTESPSRPKGTGR